MAVLVFNLPQQVLLINGQTDAKIGIKPKAIKTVICI
jgi:hypothetical protein